eukprot:759463-Hanusia_phi.AAC.1
MAIDDRDRSHRRCMMMGDVPAFRSLRFDKEINRKGWIRGRAFSASFTCISLTDRSTIESFPMLSDLTPFLPMSNPSCPYMPSIDRNGNLVAGGGYDGLGRATVHFLSMSIGRDGNFVNPSFKPQTRTRRKSWTCDSNTMDNDFVHVRLLSSEIFWGGRHITEWTSLSGLFFLE